MQTYIDNLIDRTLYYSPAKPKCEFIQMVNSTIRTIDNVNNVQSTNKKRDEKHKTHPHTRDPESVICSWLQRTYRPVEYGYK